MKRLLLASIAAIALISPAHADDPTFKIGDKAYLRKDALPMFPGCPEVNDADRAYQLGAEHDLSAMITFMLTHGCDLIPAGTEVRVENFSVWHGKDCVRQLGNPDCYWVPSKALTDQPPPQGDNP